MLRKTYDWTMHLAAKPHAIWFLAAISFIESSVFPIPPDVLLIPLILAQRENAWKIAGVCTVASVIGGFFGYAIGFYLFDLIAQPILAFYHYTDKFMAFSTYYNEWGAWVVFGAGVTPFPYKVITITSGFTQLDLVVFGVASVLSRGLRFFIVAWVLWKWGKPARIFIENNLGKLATLFFVLLLASFLALKLL